MQIHKFQWNMVKHNDTRHGIPSQRQIMSAKARQKIAKAPNSTPLPHESTWSTTERLLIWTLANAQAVLLRFLRRVLEQRKLTDRFRIWRTTPSRSRFCWAKSWHWAFTASHHWTPKLSDQDWPSTGSTGFLVKTNHRSSSNRVELNVSMHPISKSLTTIQLQKQYQLGGNIGQQWIQMLRLPLPHLCHRVEEVFIRNAQRCEGPTGVRQVLTLKYAQFMSVTSPWTNSWNVPHSNCFLWTRQVDSWNSMGNPNFIGSYEMKEKNTIPMEQWSFHFPIGSWPFISGTACRHSVTSLEKPSKWDEPMKHWGRIP